MGLKWSVRFEPATENCSVYLSETLKSFETRAFTERNPGNRAWFGVPT